MSNFTVILSLFFFRKLSLRKLHYHFWDSLVEEVTVEIGSQIPALNYEIRALKTAYPTAGLLRNPRCKEGLLASVNLLAL